MLNNKFDVRMLLYLYTVLYCAFNVYAFEVPHIKIQPLSPKGFEVSIPHIEGIKQFVFDGKLNAQLETIESNTISRTLGIHKNNKWTFSEKNIKWKHGDVLSYWFYIEYIDGLKSLDYNTTGEQVVYRDFVLDKDVACTRSATIVNGKTIDCSDTLVFEELFHYFDHTRWKVEKYNPFEGPNYEFNSYEEGTVGVKEGTLIVKPIPKLSRDEVRGELDLRYGCTSVFPRECLLQHHFLPPVMSGKITSRATFTYGKIQIRAKLPAGDWIFPEVALVPKDSKKRMIKIWIAYARGNENLQDTNGEDIGARLFFCGPTKSMNEFERRDNLANRRETIPFTRDYHTYTLVWLPTEIICFVDDIKVGEVSTKIGFQELNTEFHISLGVGVAGNNDFPDDSKTGEIKKPWINRDSKQVISFFDARYNWTSTWKGDDSALKVDSVKVYSISKESNVYPITEESRELLLEKDCLCIKSQTIVNGVTNSCRGATVFEDVFNHFDFFKWQVEKYSPSKGPNYEFNFYDKNTVEVEESSLIIKPVAKQSDVDIRGQLDLRNGCTSVFPKDECLVQSMGAVILPSVISGKITSKSTFKYGRIEVSAKLPVGDWLFTEIGLIPTDKKNRDTKILVAYARGNENLKDMEGNELGARVLYCGPIISSAENKRNAYLMKKKEKVPYSSNYHNYTLTWLPTEITCYVDGIQVGKISTVGFPDLDSEFHISLGMAVGGINDFPDNLSIETPKPWFNKDVRQQKKFFDARDLWAATWKGEDYFLKIASIAIYAI